VIPPGFRFFRAAFLIVEVVRFLFTGVVLSGWPSRRIGYFVARS
jgi:hypothetical protein